MALVKSASLRWGVIFLCMILGTWLGLFLQRFSATSLLFSNIVAARLSFRAEAEPRHAHRRDIGDSDNKMIKNIVLASGSPRRRELLAGLGWEFRVGASREAPRP